jgi:5-oxoprolinase (ATP-hydrolysing)
MGLADLKASRSRAVLRLLNAEGLAGAERLAAPLTADAVDELVGQGVDRSRVRVTVTLHLRYLGTDSSLAVPVGKLAAVRDAFEATHRQRFGFTSPGKPIEIEAIEVEAHGGGDHPQEPERPFAADQPSPRTTTRLYTAGTFHDAPIYLREDLQPGHRAQGPALIIEPHQTVAVEPSWQAEVTAKDHLLLTRIEARTRRAALGTNADPVMLEVFNKRFTAIAEQMGYALQNTARSVNIKERLDFSCAIFDGDGRLVANAPHIPVHLGSMDRSVETIRREVSDRLKPGDVWMLNAPYNGGTHLPDITVVTPVFTEGAADTLFFVAARGHHADIGGIAPGSMSPKATRIEEEGVYIDPFKLVEAGRLCEADVLALLTGGHYPARDPDQNIADLKAQAAANTKGVEEIGKLVAEYGLHVVQAYMGHVQDNAAASVARVIETLQPGSFAVETDTGAVIKVAIGVAGGKAIVDFTGTSGQQPDTFNAPEPITRACVLYVFRWSTTTSRSMPVASGTSKLSFPKPRCYHHAIPPRSPPAMSRPARPS